MSLTLQPLLRSPYRRETWATLLRDLFPPGSVALLATPAEIDSPHEQVTATRQLGHLKLTDGSRVALVEVEAADTVKLARNRIALRNFIGKLIVPGSSDAVLAVFHQQCKNNGSGDSSAWRLTYASRRTTLDPETFAVTHSETAPRRFTFLLGPSETCRTAAGRLKELEGKEKLTLDELERAFSVERLNKDFFKRYKEFYERFTAHLLTSEKAADTRKAFGISPHTDPKEQDKADKPVRDFSKKLLGRLVFLHFLQKKRWLGCPPHSTDWTLGEENFITAFFDKAKAAGEADRFHSTYLAPLFFEALNTPDRQGDLFPLTGTRLPYLNGGLFEEDTPALRTLDFPPLLFEELLGFFGEYHFTIDENDPEDHEVGIDPEMLGHIFENLLEDNKDKGAFYTPKAIVQYMARESLRHYLETHLGPDPEIATLLAEKDLALLGKNGFVRQHAKKIAKLLEDVKICDPAIGSGAFPIGLLQEILWTRLTLNWELNTPKDRARLKRDIIKNSIHGVDLDPGAVEIARLRFWLALVVDEEIPRPLPNLDYKIMQGDGLLESFEGIDLSRIASGNQTGYALTGLIGGQSEFSLDDAKTQMELQVNERKEIIAGMLRDYFSETDPVQKKQRHAAIDAEVLGHLDHAIGFEHDRIDGLLDQQRKMLAGKIARIKGWTQAKGEKAITTLEGEHAALREKANKLRALQQSSERPFFLWHLYFQEVFEDGGFDIVLANPPYVRQETIREYKPLLKREGYECFTGTADLFVYFYEKAVNLLRSGGTLTFITSNKYYRAGYGEKLRSFLTKELTLHTLIDFGDAPVFDAIAYASILVATKGSATPANHSLNAYTWQPADPIGSLHQVMTDKSIELAQADLTADGWRLEDPASIRLMEKLRKNGTSLGDYVGGKFYYGIKTGFNEAFVLTGEQRNLLIDLEPDAVDFLKPYLRGKDVKRWQATSANLWLLFIPWHFPLQDDPEVNGASKKAEQEFLSRFPKVYEHLSKFKNLLSARNQDETGIRYEWYALQRCAASYSFEFSKPKVIYPDIYHRPSFAFEDKGYFCSNTTYFIPHESEAQPLTALLNSSALEWFYGLISNRIRGGYLRAFSDYIGQIPIPPATGEDKARLTTLAERAAGFAKSGDNDSLRATEREINGIVYQLFHLTPAEIALIEKAVGTPETVGHHGEPDKKEALFRRLRLLGEQNPYVSFEAIKKHAHETWPDIKDDTLRQYLSEASTRGFLLDAGKGWYSSLPNPAVLSAEPVQKWIDFVSEAFPLLEFTCWATVHWNPWLRHLINRSTIFIQADSVNLPSVHEYLVTKKIDSRLNPTAVEIAKNPLGPETVVLRPRLKAAPGEGPMAPTEQFVVDSWIENKAFNLFDSKELKESALRWIRGERVQFSSLLSYLKSRVPKSDELLMELSTI